MRRPARSLALGGLLIAAVLSFIIYQGLSSNLVYYITPSELLAKGAAAQGQNFRIGGQIRPGSIHWNARTRRLSFVIQDGKTRLPVQSRGIDPPELFFDSQMGCVVEGTYLTQGFTATNIMIKHSSTYVAPKAGKAPVDGGYVHKP